MAEGVRVAAVWLLLTVAAGAAAEVSFSGEIVPLLEARCVACHLTGQELGGMALHAKAAYTSLVGVSSRQSGLNRVEPGEPGKSYLYLKLLDQHLPAGGDGEPMPLGAWPLAPAEIDLVRRWIAEGAPAN